MAAGCSFVLAWMKQMKHWKRLKEPAHAAIPQTKRRAESRGVFLNAACVHTSIMNAPRPNEATGAVPYAAAHYSVQFVTLDEEALCDIHAKRLLSGFFRQRSPAWHPSPAHGLLKPVAWAQA